MKVLFGAGIETIYTHFLLSIECTFIQMASKLDANGSTGSSIHLQHFLYYLPQKTVMIVFDCSKVCHSVTFECLVVSLWFGCGFLIFRQQSWLLLTAARLLILHPWSIVSCSFGTSMKNEKQSSCSGFRPIAVYKQNDTAYNLTKEGGGG